MSKKKLETSTAVPSLTHAGDAVDADVQQVERAFAAGNFSAVREIANSSTSPPAKEAALRLFPRMNLERDQLLTGVAGLLVISIAAAFVLVAR